MSTRTLKFLTVVVVLLTVAGTARAQGWVPFKINTGGNDLNTVYFLDSKRGWVGGDGGYLSSTDDSGQSWVRQTVRTTAGINDIYFRDKEAGFLLAGNAIFVTGDNGAHWTQSRIFLPEEFEGADVELYSVRFSSKKKGWVVGSISKHERVVDSILVYTDDGGETWRRQRAPSRLELIHIDFVSDKRGWIVGDGGTILFTRDGGASWTKQNAGFTGTLYHIDFRNDKNGWAVGERGTLLRTIDGGETWSVVPTNVSVTLLSVQFLNDEEGWAIGRGGTILRSNDEGKTWVRQESTTKQNLYSIYFNKKIGWAVGGTGIVLRYERD
ncbi:MAG TPA: YCF48-related protein [Pyrinomonadaceae bacterium]|nr:YCF48-related protein [Pyrinomonadaceae bacterium]HLM23885.1 YCF48-related protein [Pyrinomonadaceae bacterium]